MISLLSLQAHCLKLLLVEMIIVHMGCRLVYSRSVADSKQSDGLKVDGLREGFAVPLSCS